MTKKAKKCAVCANLSEFSGFGWCLFGGFRNRNLTCPENKACKKFVRRGGV